MKHFGLDLEQSRGVLGQFLYPCCCGTKRVPLESKPSGRRGPLVDQYGSGEATGSVIDVAKKTIKFRTFRGAQVRLEVVAGHLTRDLEPKHASALQKQLTPQMLGQARQGLEATVLPPSSENIDLDSSFLTHPVAVTATP